MVGLKATGVVVIYIYMYIHIYIYTYIYIHICLFMCATVCGKRTYFMLSGWFSSLRGFSTPDCFGCMIVSHTRGCLGAGVCVYIYWSNLHVDAYILQVDTHEFVMCVDRCCTRSSHVTGYIYLYIRWVCLYIFTYMRTEFTCVGICLHICT